MMKRTYVFMAVLCVLLLTGGARAAGAVDRDCAFVTALYSQNGQFLDCVRVNVPSGERIPDAATFDNMPSGAYTATFLLDSATLAPIPTPTATPAPTPTTGPVWTSDVYAILYDDGTMVFQHGNTPETGRTVKNTYPVDMVDGYVYDSGIRRPTTPWHDVRKSITRVDFADAIRPQSTAYWFYGFENLEEIENIRNLNTSSVTTMRNMFQSCFALKRLDTSGFDTSHVTDMRSMFWGCYSLTDLDVSGWNTSQVTDMGSMFGGGVFYGCVELKHLDVSGWNTSQVTNMSAMFYGCGLTDLDVSGWNTSQVTDMNHMFSWCSGLTTLDASGFNTSNVTDMSDMFSNCTSLTTLDISGFDTSKVMYMTSMFYNSWDLTTIYASNNFVTGHYEEQDFSSMFDLCTSLIGGAGTVYDENHVDAEYARIDNPPSAPGYFTRKA